MQKLARIFHAGHQGNEPSPHSAEQIDQNYRITLGDVYRYRKQRGVNFGSWFTLERWITDGPFRQAQQPAQSDFDVANGSNAKQILEEHWDTWIVEDDWKWLSEHGINTVRIPFGFYHLYALNPSVVSGTDFAHVGEVFSGAWARILRAIDTADRYGIGVLLDLHAAPGKQNGDAHSGQTGPVRFFESRNMSKAKDVLCILASALIKGVTETGENVCRDNIVGIQLLNEPQNHGSLPGWYASTAEAVHKIAPGLPIYIHDAWSTQQFAEFASSRKEFVVVDHHLYRCFTQDDQRLSGDEHANNLRQNFSATLANFSGTCNGNLVVAEFSAALNPASLRSGEAGEQDRQRRVLARAELDIFEAHCAGWYFWCYKKNGWDAGWSLRDTVTAEIMPAWVGIRKTGNLNRQSDPTKRDAAKASALGSHAGYWNQFPGNYEHWRFEEGFIQGWEDAYAFFSFDVGSSVSELGFKGQWAKRRLAAHVQSKGSSKSLWEYEHGFNQGVDAARNAFVSDNQQL